MSLQARERYPIPAETARVARAMFPKGNLVMRLSDELGMIFHDQDCADLFPIQGQPTEGPTRLALVTLLPFMEGLTEMNLVRLLQWLAGEPKSATPRSAFTRLYSTAA